MRILIIDDEDNLRHMLQLLLTQEGHEAHTVSNADDGLKALAASEYDLVICDMKMPGLSGLEFLAERKARGLEVTTLVMSAYASRQEALEAIRLGAYDFISKPFQNEEMIFVIEKAVERSELLRENKTLKGKSSPSDQPFAEVVTQSESMKRVFDLVRKVSAYKSTVLLTGESGTGKELIARSIHLASPRKNGPFVGVNCAAIPDTLLESELFGHVRGAFTDANTDKAGLVEVAQGGTLFLDEIGDLSPGVQVKLLRFLQEEEIRRVGDTRNIPVDCRLVCATVRDLQDMVKQKTFREDLFYRLNVFHIHLPPLRERPGDIPLLARFFLKGSAARMRSTAKRIADEAMALLQAYPWPGNVRELENVIERALVLAEGEQISIQDLPEKMGTAARNNPALFSDDDLSIKKATSKLEDLLIRRALIQTRGNKTLASKLLEISHRALLYKIKEYGIDDASMRTR